MCCDDVFGLLSVTKGTVTFKKVAESQLLTATVVNYAGGGDFLK